MSKYSLILFEKLYNFTFFYKKSKVENRKLFEITPLSLDNGFLQRVYPTLISKPNLRKTSSRLSLHLFVPFD